MLLLSYVYFSLTSAVSITYRLMFILNGEIVNMTIYLLAALGPLLLLPAFAYLYIFACRHILKDNEILRINIFAVIIVFYGLATAMVATDTIYQNPSFNLIFEIDQLVFSSAVLVTPDIFTVSYIWFIQIFQIFISIYVTGRVGWRGFRLARKSDQPVRKRGLQAIGSGMLLYLIGGMLSAFDSTFSIYPALMITVAVLRALVFSSAYVLMYLGWIMPAWFRRMIRKRSWFEIQYSNLTKGA